MELAQANSAWIVNQLPQGAFKRPAQRFSPATVRLPAAPSTARTTRGDETAKSDVLATAQAYAERLADALRAAADSAVSHVRQLAGEAPAAGGEEAQAPVPANSVATRETGGKTEDGMKWIAYRHLSFAAEQGNVDAVRQMGDYMYYGYGTAADVPFPTQ